MSSVVAVVPSTGPPGGAPALSVVEREKLHVVGRMSSSVAHELRNPLATIVATTQSLLAFWTLPGLGRGPGGDAPDPAPSEQLREDLELVLAEAKRASEIVSTLLSFVRRQEGSVAPVSLSAVVRRARALLAHELEAQRVKLEEFGTGGAADGAPWVLGNENELLQVLVNLIANAQQAVGSSRGGGVVRVGVERVESGRVALVVEDDGPGVPAEARERIFEPFFTTKGSGEGTGLGLSISHGIVERHGGTIGVGASPAGGARFSVELPAIAVSEAIAAAVTPGVDTLARVRLAAAACALVPTAEAESGAGGGPHVLLVDDEPGIRRIVGRFLRKCGYRVEECANGRVAVAALRVHRFDAVVSDLRMPDLSGEELFEVVRRERPELVERFVLTSGDLLRRGTQQFVQEAGCLFLEKPYELTDLLAVLERVCGAPAAAQLRLVGGGARR